VAESKSKEEKKMTGVELTSYIVMYSSFFPLIRMLSSDGRCII